MPLFVIAAVKTAKNAEEGPILTAPLFIVGSTVLAPLALAELLKPVLNDIPMDIAGFGMFLFLSITYAVLATANLIHLKRTC
jgi:hypothetical protein